VPRGGRVELVGRRPWNGKVDFGLLRLLFLLRRRQLDDLDGVRLRALEDLGLRAVLVGGCFEHVDVFDRKLVLFFIVFVGATRGQDRRQHVAPESRERDRRRAQGAADRTQCRTDRMQHVAHAQRRRDHDRDDQPDEREQRGADRADHRARDLREVLAERAAWAVTRDAIVRRDQVHEHRERDHAEQRAEPHHDRHDRLAIEQHAHGRDRGQHDQEIAAHAREPVVQARDRAPERPHHERVGLQRDHRDQQEQRDAEPDHPNDLAPLLGRPLRRSIWNSSIFGHGEE
jgi:hypothetical protein